MTEEQIRNEVNGFRSYIIVKHDSPNTADAYCPAIFSFLTYFGKRPKDITAQEIIDYLLTKINIYTRRNVHSAIKKYYISKSKFGFVNKFKYIPYPERPQTLPIPITKEEFVAIIRATDNLKHKCILMLGFDCGMRVSEVCNMRPEHLDFNKMQVCIVQSKGKKDRVLKMSSVLSGFLREYLIQYATGSYLFKGQFSDRYSERSCQQILHNCAAKAGIKRRVTFHQNRHGFAVTHLENNTELERLKEMLGHKSLETTRIYAPLNNKEIQRHDSPLEQIMKESLTNPVMRIGVGNKPSLP